MTTKTAWVIRAVYGRKGLYTSSLTVQRRCLSTSSIRHEISEAGTTSPRRIPLVQEWDGILITPLKGKQHQSKLDPTRPIRSESEFRKNTLSGDLAAQRIKSREKSEKPFPQNSAKQKNEEQKMEQGEQEEAFRASAAVVDVGPLIRRTQKPERTSMSWNTDAADAALQSFQGTGRLQSNRSNQRNQQTKSKKGAKSANSTHTSGAKGPSTAKASRKRRQDMGDQAIAALQNMPYSATPSTRSSSRSQSALMKVFDGDNFAVPTPFKLQSPDPDTVTFSGDKTHVSSESLTVLDPQLFLDTSIDAQVKYYEGRYDKHFRTENWESIDKLKSRKVLTPGEYASLTIARNPSLGIKQKKRSISIVEQVLQRARTSALPAKSIN